MAKRSTFGFLGHYSVLNLQLIHKQPDPGKVGVASLAKGSGLLIQGFLVQEALPFHCQSGGCQQLAGLTGNSLRVAHTVGDIFPLTTLEVQRLTQLPPQEMPLT